MKKIYTILGIAAMVAVLASCAKEELNNNENQGEEIVEETVFIGSFEQPADDNDGKTVMGGEDNHKILWNKGDAIRIWDKSGKSGKFGAEQAGATSQFGREDVDKDFVAADAAYAFYPESAVKSMDANGIIKFTIPETQTYASNSFGQDANFAVSIIQDAVDPDGEPYKALPFTNVAGVLRIQLTCSANTRPVSVRRIVLKDRSQNICGTFSVDATAEKPAAKYVENGGKTITLNCGKDGVALSTDPANPTSFYITVPVGAIAQNNGFVAEVYNAHDHLVSVLKTSNANGNATIKRSHITRMNNKNVPWLPIKCIEYDYLQSTGAEEVHPYPYAPSEGVYWKSQLINTRVNPSAGVRIQMRAILDSPNSWDCGDAYTQPNPAFCGVIDPENPAYYPWISIDYHRGVGGVRACANANSQFAIPLIRPGQMFVCDVNFFYGENNFTGNINGTEFTSTIGNGSLPNSTNFFLFGEGRTTGLVTQYAENRASCSIHMFVMYDKDNKMIRNFIPVAYENGEGKVVNGMWDMASPIQDEANAFYTNFRNDFNAGSFNVGTTIVYEDQE